MTNNLLPRSETAAPTGPVAALAAPVFDPVFWPSEQLGTESDWWGHVPFGHWIVSVLRPRVLVEEGRPDGVSYAAFRRAVARAGLATRCHAACADDAGMAETRFADGSVDLLHIDLPGDEAVSRDALARWLPKLSDAAVLLLHNTGPRDGSRGTRLLWQDLSARHPHFGFPHGEGLGVIAMGARVAPAVAELCGLAAPAEAERMRDRFAALGDRWECGAREAAQRRDAALWRTRFREEARARAQVAHRLATARRDLVAANQRAERSEDRTRAEAAEAELAAILRSRMRLGWRAARLAWWTVTFQLPSRYREWRYWRQVAAANPAPAAPDAAPPVQEAAQATPAEADTADPALPEIDGFAERTAAARAALMTFLASDKRLVFAPARDPDVSLLLLLPDRGAAVLRCLAALHAQDGPSFEVVAIVAAEDAETRALLSRVDGIRILDARGHGGPLAAFNHAAAMTRGRVLLFLDEAAALRPGAIAAACAALPRAGEIGAVGGRIVGASGRLQSAGGIVWSDARLEPFGHGLREDAGDAMFRREVDVVETVLLTTRAAWDRLDGFDPGFADLRYGWADYCLRLGRAGLRSLHDPRLAADVDVAVEWSRVSLDTEATRRSQADFRHRHADALRQWHLPAAKGNRLVARDARRPRRKRLLMIDSEVPFGALGAGYPRAKAMLAVAADAGWSITLYPLRNATFDWEAAWQEVSVDIEIADRLGLAGLEAFLLERKGFYDAVLISRPDNMEFVHGILRRHPDLLDGARRIYDAEAVFANRDIVLAALEGRPYSTEQAEELCNAEANLTAGADAVTCVSASEAAFFRDRVTAPVLIVNHPVTVAEQSPPFQARSGFLFVGRLLEHAAPNWRGLSWFIRECWPAVRVALPDATLTVVGHVNADHAALMGPGVRIAGPAEDLQPCYDAARVFVAPVRFAAGVPIKAIEATAGGIPTVATRLMAQQLGWQPDVELAAEDEASAMAAACVALHEDAEAWAAMRAAAMARLRREYGAEQFGETLRAALSGVAPPDPGGRTDEPRAASRVAAA